MFMAQPTMTYQQPTQQFNQYNNTRSAFDQPEENMNKSGGSNELDETKDQRWKSEIGQSLRFVDHSKALKF